MTVRKKAHPTWEEFIRQARPQTDWSEVGLVLCLDPGETTGFAVFSDGRLVHRGQEPTGDDPASTAELIELLNGYMDPEHPALSRIVYEEYRIRGNKAQQHIGSEVITIQHIGVIKATAAQLNIPTTKQTASQVKAFATDTHLRRWGLYQAGQRHSNDAVRHGVYYHLFAAGRSK